jgi:hypothetical protein
MAEKTKTETTDTMTQLEKETEMVFGLINDALLKVEWAEACRDGALNYIRKDTVLALQQAHEEDSEVAPHEVLAMAFANAIGAVLDAAENEEITKREAYLLLLQVVKLLEPEGICEDCKKAAMSSASAGKVDTPWHQQPGKGLVH